jgi:hypothetical protein
MKADYPNDFVCCDCVVLSDACLSTSKTADSDIDSVHTVFLTRSSISLPTLRDVSFQNQDAMQVKI